MASTIPPVKAALEAAWSPLAGVEITSRNWPVDDEVKSLVWIGDVEGGEEESANLKAIERPRDEIYEIAIMISISDETDDYVALEAEAQEVYDRLTAYLRSEPQLESHYTGPGQLFWVVAAGTRSLNQRISPDGVSRECEWTWGVRVRARI